jgi:hypothetical protein
MYILKIKGSFTGFYSSSISYVCWYFDFQFLQLLLDPASGNTLSANGKGSIKQNLRVTNSQHGKVNFPCL